MTAKARVADPVGAAHPGLGQQVVGARQWSSG